MERIVDARGLACPQPVVRTKQALEEAEGSTLVTIVDNEVARDNVVKFARSRGLRAEVEERGTEYYIRIGPGEIPDLPKEVSPVLDQVLLIGSATLGRGDEELGRLLMQSFLATLAQADALPRKILLINSGVRLACEGSPVLASLLALEQKGVEIASCGTCLDFYRMKEKLCVGGVTNMYSIVEALAGAQKVISL